MRLSPSGFRSRGESCSAGARAMPANGTQQPGCQLCRVGDEFLPCCLAGSMHGLMPRGSMAGRAMRRQSGTDLGGWKRLQLASRGISQVSRDMPISV